MRKKRFPVLSRRLAVDLLISEFWAAEVCDISALRERKIQIIIRE